MEQQGLKIGLCLDDAFAMGWLNCSWGLPTGCSYNYINNSQDQYFQTEES